MQNGEPFPPDVVSETVSVLIVDDDVDLSGDLAAHLRNTGFEVRIEPNVPAGRRALAEATPDICLVDIVMPGPSGKVFCREVVDRSDCGVIMMSSLNDSDTIIALLEIGADDYIVKPFRFGEMVARVRAVLRRRGPTRDRSAPENRIGPWVFDPQDRRMRHDDGFAITLTPSETEVLRFLSASPGTVFGREDLLAVSRTRQHGGADDRAVDNLIKRMRKKIEVDPAAPRHVVTVWGKGYRLDP